MKFKQSSSFEQQIKSVENRLVLLRALNHRRVQVKDEIEQIIGRSKPYNFEDNSVVKDAWLTTLDTYINEHNNVAAMINQLSIEFKAPRVDLINETEAAALKNRIGQTVLQVIKS